MRVLLDEQLPRQLARELRGHDVRTVRKQNWAGLKNGELLRRAADDGFEVLVTADQNLEFQQNLAGSRLRVVVLVAPSNALEDLLPNRSEVAGRDPDKSTWNGRPSSCLTSRCSRRSARRGGVR